MNNNKTERAFRDIKDEKRLNAAYRLPPVIAIILHHGESKFSGCTELSELFVPLVGMERYLPKLQAILVDLSAIDESALPYDTDVPELKVVLGVLKTVFQKNVSTKVKDILEELKPASENPEIRDLIRLIWLYIVSSAKYAERNYENLLSTIKDVTGDDEMPTMLEIWGAELEAKGEARGEAKAGAKAVLTVLRARFKNVSSDVEKAIYRISDPISLDSWAAHAATCDSLDEFEQSLR